MPCTGCKNPSPCPDPTPCTSVYQNSLHAQPKPVAVPKMPPEVKRQFAFFRRLASDPNYYKTRMGTLLDWITEHLDPAPQDCRPGSVCERHAQGLGGCVAGECKRGERADGVLAVHSTATVERLMELVHTLPPRSMREQRNSHLAEIEAIALTLRDGVDLPDGAQR